METTSLVKLRVKVRSVSFDRPSSEISVLDFIASQNFFESPEVRQLHRFFSEVGMTQFSDANRRTFVGHDLYEKLYYECRTGDICWVCYHSASFMSLKCDEYRNFVFGFADQYNGTKENPSLINSFLHAFCANENVEEPKFVDANIELACIDMREQFDRHKRECRNVNCARKRPDLVMEDFRSYSGTIIPRQVVDDIFNMPLKQDRGHGSFYAYLKQTVFNDNDRTSWFIDVVKNDGKGWEYAPLQKK